MKKIFTLISAVLCAASVSAQTESYEAIVDGSLAPEFAAVAGAAGGVANNVKDGKSIVTVTTGKATVTAVGGTTPANDTNVGGGAQQITPGAVVDADKHLYELASVGAWNDITWGKGNRGDINFNWVTGTGNPYVSMLAEEIVTDGVGTGNYKVATQNYAPDGSLGLPVTGLYYKFTSTVAGAFKVKVWINKNGSGQTYVVNAKDAKAQRLYASGYINGQTENGQLKFLSVEQVDSVHNAWILEGYAAAVEKGSLLSEQEYIDSVNVDAGYQYFVGRNNQPFFGWLTFDVEAGDEYLVFQGSTQIGFGGYEFYEGGSAEELINGIEADYTYATNFSTYEDEDSGERVTWHGEKIVGNGQFASTDEEGAVFGNYYHNDGSAKRTSYCLLPEEVFAHSAKTEALTVGVWVRAQEQAKSADYMWAPLLTAYGAAPVGGVNTFPMLALQYRGVLQVNCSGFCDYADAQNVKGVNTLYHGGIDWLADKKWHYYTAVFDGENAKVYIDGELKNEWADASKGDPENRTTTQKGLFSNGADLKYVCLGGNQAWELNDNDAPFDFAKLIISNKAFSAGEIASQMLVDYPTWGQDDTAVESIKTVQTVANGAVFNLAGQRVDKSFKGIVIINGKKIVVK